MNDYGDAPWNLSQARRDKGMVKVDRVNRSHIFVNLGKIVVLDKRNKKIKIGTIWKDKRWYTQSIIFEEDGYLERRGYSLDLECFPRILCLEGLVPSVGLLAGSRILERKDVVEDLEDVGCVLLKGIVGPWFLPLSLFCLLFN